MDTFLPYFAGFFDGEGSIGLYRSGNTSGRTLRVQLTQNVSPASTVLLSECRSRWGGSMCEMNRQGKRTAWNWQASAASGARALTDIRPWLRLKAKEADIALEWWTERPLRQRGPQGHFLPLTETEHDAAVAAEVELKAAKVGMTPTSVGRMRLDGTDIIQLRYAVGQISNNR
jgi:hypothetical protein